MKRRAGGEAGKSAGHKTGMATRTPSKEVRGRGSATTSQETEIARVTRERDEVQEQQAATASILKIISRSTFDLQTVLDALVESAARLCGTGRGCIFLRDGDLLRLASIYGLPERTREALIANPLRVASDTAGGHAVQTKSVYFVSDVATYHDYSRPDLAEISEYRAIIGVPLLQDGEAIGVFSLPKREPGDFTPRQIEMLRTFADQAVVAINNARLFGEVQQRTQDLTESLEQQTAMSEVLRVISSSPGDLEPVFATMLQNAVRLCDSKFGNIYRWDGDALRLLAAHNSPPAIVEHRRRTPYRPHPNAPMGRMVASKRLVHIVDAAAEEAYVEHREPGITAAVELGGIRTYLIVPMLKENELIGVFTVFRQEVRPFTDKQIEFVQNFAAQAVIAIENARLLNELRQRTTDLSQRTSDLTEALEQQTATSEVLKVISSSLGDLRPVFDAMLEKAVRICQADAATLFLYDNGVLRRAARHSGVADVVMPITPSAKSGTMRSITTKQIVHIPNYLADPAYLEGRDDFVVAAAEQLNIRASLHVPMLREPDVVGAFTIWRTDARAFTEKQIELVSNFAAQAVIAIENARLLNELRQRTDDLTESLQQQTATSDVLKVISRSAFDLQSVFDTLISSAVELSGAFNGTICLRDGDGYRYLATAGIQGEFRKYLSEHPPKPGRASAAGRVLLSGEVVSVPDVLKDPDYIVPAFDLNKTRSVLGVPLLREDKVEGALVLARVEPGLFAQRHIDLVQSFADQAVIAIENVRLFDEVQARTKELSLSLDELRTAQDRLIQTEKLASLGQLTAGIAHEIKNPLNFVNNFSGVSVELIDELQEALHRVQADDSTRSEIGELADMLRDNLSKIVQHGRRADAIVKNMLLHSREGSGEHRAVDINAIVEEALNLAYHGARAEKQDFAITLQRSFDPEAGQADVFPQDITRVLLNLISNSFYAATKRKGTAGSEGFQPTVAAATRSLGDRVEIGIRDNGLGIPPEVKKKMFNPFFTTKPAGEGTGLGLSISYDIVVKQHAGSIEVDTELGAFTEIRIVLPRSAAHLPRQRA